MSRTPDSTPVPRRDFLRVLGGAAAGFASLALVRPASALTAQPPKKAAPTAAPAAAKKPAARAAGPRDIVVYKDPNCGCCKLWVNHMSAAGFTATVHDTGDMASVKASMGMPPALDSCHIGRVGGYTIVGHVPADVIEQLLKEKPVGLGLAVPGMPMGSPGMEQGSRKDKYDVILFEKGGKQRVYASR